MRSTEVFQLLKDTFNATKLLVHNCAELWPGHVVSFLLMPILDSVVPVVWLFRWLCCFLAEFRNCVCVCVCVSVCVCVCLCAGVASQVRRVQEWVQHHQHPEVLHRGYQVGCHASGTTSSHTSQKWDSGECAALKPCHWSVLERKVLRISDHFMPLWSHVWLKNPSLLHLFVWSLIKSQIHMGVEAKELSPQRQTGPLSICHWNNTACTGTSNLKEKKWV